MSARTTSPIEMLLHGGEERGNAWRVRPAAPAQGAAPVAKKTSWLAAWRQRREPTLFQRCLAVHIHFAGPRGGMS